jgi:hypothetical protein
VLRELLQGDVGVAAQVLERGTPGHATLCRLEGSSIETIE